MSVVEAGDRAKARADSWQSEEVSDREFGNREENWIYGESSMKRRFGIVVGVGAGSMEEQSFDHKEDVGVGGMEALGFGQTGWKLSCIIEDRVGEEEPGCNLGYSGEGRVDGGVDVREWT